MKVLCAIGRSERPTDRAVLLEDLLFAQPQVDFAAIDRSRNEHKCAIAQCDRSTAQIDRSRTTSSQDKIRTWPREHSVRKFISFKEFCACYSKNNSCASITDVCTVCWETRFVTFYFFILETQDKIKFQSINRSHEKSFTLTYRQSMTETSRITTPTFKSLQDNLIPQNTNQRNLFNKK